MKILLIVNVFDGVGINLEISVVDLSTGEVATAKPMRGEVGWTVGELKQYIGEVRERILFTIEHENLQEIIFTILIAD